jgi:hypothetical protein
MFDPAAIGTAIIGLERVRREEEQYARGVALPPRQQRDQRPVGRAFDAALRRTAHPIQPTSMPTR